jgi:hypothetical protein
MNHKILVGVVTNACKDYCWDDYDDPQGVDRVGFAKQLRGLQAQGHDVLIIDNSPSPKQRKGFKTYHYKKYKQILNECYIKNLNLPNEKKINGLIFITLDCMNILRDKFLEGDYTHLFILESDVFIEKDTVQNLLDMNTDVANYTYLMNLNRFDDLTLCVQSTKDNVGRMLNPEQSRELINTGVKQFGKDMLGDRMLSACGYGCTLVRREVLEKIKFRINKTAEGQMTFPDSAFHPDVVSNGFIDKLDTDYLPHHENLHNQTMDMIKILNVQKTSRRERRKLRK